MKPAGIYILEVIVCSGLLLAFYQLLLARKVPFRACRRYLLASALLSVVIPLLRLPILPAQTVYLEIPVAGAAGAAGAGAAGISPAAAAPAPAGAAAAAFPWEGVLLAAYAAVTLLLLVILVRCLLSIRHLRKASRLTPLPEYTLAEHPKILSPFSFWRTIFLRQEERPDSNERTMVVAHEAAHIRHRHSLDKVVLGVMKALFWFNPFFWMMERMLSEVQEYEADEDVLRAGYNVDSYRLAIFKQLFGYYPDLTSGLSHSLTKKRFTMMNQAPRGSLSWLRLGAALPLFAGLLVAFGATARPISSDPQGPDQAQSVQNDPNTITVFITANDTKNVTINGETVALADLDEFLQKPEFDAPFRFVLESDAETRMETVLNVSAQLEDAYVRKGFPASPEAQKGSLDLRKQFRNTARKDFAIIRINSANRVLFADKEIHIGDDFAPYLKDYFRAHGDKAIISIKYDLATTYRCYCQVKQEIWKAHREVLDEIACSRYGKPLEELDEEAQKVVYEALPLTTVETDTRK